MKNQNIQIQLSKYAKAGGTVLLTCQFSNHISPPNFARMFRNMQLPWGFGDYYRADFLLNPTFESIFGSQMFVTLKKSYSMKTVHLQNVPAEARIYLPKDKSYTQSMASSPSKTDTTQCPAVLQKHGEGFVGFIGDVNNENGSQALMMAMLSTFSPLKNLDST
ncbi:hypothetical protein MMC28_009456 [Mycoblastus sanguinarius]|nr:hypothetical protein [Mycoblastus sanguinarius]